MGPSKVFDNTNQKFAGSAVEGAQMAGFDCSLKKMSAMKLNEYGQKKHSEVPVFKLFYTELQRGSNPRH